MAFAQSIRSDEDHGTSMTNKSISSPNLLRVFSSFRNSENGLNSKLMNNIQTAVPLFFVYIPYLTVLNLPFFNLPVFFWDDACMLLTSCFPAWDAVIAIVLMGDYRYCF